MIKAVLFDLDDTLLDREASARYFVERQYERFHPALAHLPQTAYVERFMTLDQHGLVPKDKVYRQLVSEFGITDISWPVLAEDYYGQFDRYCLNLPGLDSMLQTLVKQQRVLGIITNGPSPFQQQKIKAMGIADYFAVILVSAKEGVKKPNPEIFRRAVANLGVTAAETIFVGDNPQADIDGARKFGMQTVWKRVPFWGDCPAPDAICDDLTQLPAIVETLEARLSG